MADIKTIELSIVIPTFQGEELLSPVIEKIIRVLEGWQFEVIVVDDGGGDESVRALEHLCESFPNCRLISLKENRGQQEATIIGIESANGKILVTIDDDGEQNPGDIITLIDEVKAGFDLVYGVPELEGARVKSKIQLGSLIRNRLFVSLLGAPAGIRVSSFRCFSRELWLKAKGNTHSGFSYLSAILFSVNPRVKSIPLEFYKREGSRYSFKKRLILFSKLFWYYGLRRSGR